jgi:hypothetical protein
MDAMYAAYISHYFFVNKFISFIPLKLEKEKGKHEQQMMHARNNDADSKLKVNLCM